MADLAERMREALEEQGGRMTRQRRTILEVLQESDCHLTARQVFERAHRRDRRVTLSTVYRTLDLCKELGLVRSRRLDPEQGPEWFEPTEPEEHYHFICTRCGNVIEFQAPEINGLLQRLRGEMHVTPRRASISIYGLCRRCAQVEEE